MTQTLAEVLILVPTAFGTGLLIFIAGVIQGVMNDLEEADFKHFLTLLDRHAMRSPYALTVSLLPVIAAIPYYYFYGFHNWWFTAGIIVWIVGSTTSKIFNLPIYKRVMDPTNNDAIGLREERRKLQAANVLRATLNFAAVVLMVIGIV